MISYELAAKAVKDPGFKIKMKQWREDEYIYWCEVEKIWKDEYGETVYHPDFHEINNWEEYKEPKKKIKLYFPKIFRDFKTESNYFIYKGDEPFSKNKNAQDFFTDKDKYGDDTYQVISWHEIEVEE